MKIFQKPALLGTTLLLITFFSACGVQENNTVNDCFKTKKDSVDFAKLVYEKYQLDTGAKQVSFVDPSLKTMQSEAVPWDTITKYAANYDRNPILTQPGGGLNYKGFKLNATSFSQMKNNASCAQLYFRLGKKDNGDYTFMVLPMNSNNDIIQTRSLPAGQNINHDHLDPCPTVCPNNWQ